jgi:hypothetical protein
MTYHPDLSPFSSIIKHIHDIPLVSIGWLDSSQAFVQGETSDLFRDKLLALCANHHPVIIHLGYHLCQFCPGPAHIMPIKYKGRVSYPGNSYIFVLGQKIIYVAPNLLYHYVVAHNYLPPKEFIEAVLKSPLPDSKEYKIFSTELVFKR